MNANMTAYWLYFNTMVVAIIRIKLVVLPLDGICFKQDFKDLNLYNGKAVY